MQEPIVLRGEFVDLRPLTVADAARPAMEAQRAGAKLKQGQRPWKPGTVDHNAPPTEFNFVIELKDGRPWHDLAGRRGHSAPPG